MGLWSRITSLLAPPKAAPEGEYRPGPYLLRGGYLSAEAGSSWNWWQRGYDLSPATTRSAMVEACRAAYAQTIAMCPGDHWVTRDDGGRDRVTTSALCRVIRTPNDYQTISDFLMNLVRYLYADGNAYALALRNSRQEISELHLMNPVDCTPLIASDGTIFYDLGGNEIIDKRLGSGKHRVPARNVLHVRLHTPVHPLKGETPLMAAALDMAAANAMMAQQLRFFTNQARPSFIAATDQQLTREQTDSLRDHIDAKSTGLNQGGTMVFSHGLKPIPLTAASKDSQLAEIMKMSNENVALSYRVPLQILGMGGTPFASTEALMSSWKANGLGFALNHIEEAIGRTFGLKGYPDEYVEFDTDALMRSSFKEMVDGFGVSVISGMHSPDEARARLGLPRVPGGAGKEPRVQQQVVPLSYGMDLKPPPATPPAVAAPDPDEPEDVTSLDPEQEAADAARNADYAILERLNDQSLLH